MTFLVHLTMDGEETEGNLAVRLSTHWVFHPTKDSCFAYCGSLNRAIHEKTGKYVFKKSIDDRLVWSRDKLKELSMSEPVRMIGYPRGLWDKKNNFPIFRYGYTAAHPGYDFNEDGIGLVDMACFPGSSGSPIFILNEGSYWNKQGKLVGQSRLIFLGTLFGGPTISAEGKLPSTGTPAAPVESLSSLRMMNLGYYVKSYELEVFKEFIEEDLRRRDGKEMPCP